METRKVDSRGRINLGKEFANKTVLFEKIGETEFKLELAGSYTGEGALAL